MAASEPAPSPSGDDDSKLVQSVSLSKKQMSVLVSSVFVAGLCSIVYELLIGTASSYFLGDSIQQFSVTIGLFMAAMGMGSFLSRNLRGEVFGRFVAVEIALGMTGGLSIPVLYYIYAYTDLYYPAMVLFIVTIGVLTGLEVPMLVLALRRQFSLEKNLSNILSLDYLGALGATLLFPFVLLPTLGTFRSSLAVGLLNLLVAFLVLRVFSKSLSPRRRATYQTLAVLSSALLLLGIMLSGQLLRPWHGAVYEDRAVLIEHSEYQRIVLTRGRDDLRMFLDGNLQFSSVDEYRYHEALVHPAMSLARDRSSVLILGGGDGLPVREVLKYPDVQEATVVDLDPAVTRIAREHPMLSELNQHALSNERVRLVHQDAFVFVQEQQRRWDVIIVDLPDPNNASLARLYSREFYGSLRRRLSDGGMLVAQATSPFFSRDAFWCIERTLSAAGLDPVPYHAYVPSFGDWGFMLASARAPRPSDIRIQVPTRYLDDQTLPRLFIFEKDLRNPDAQTSTLDRPLVLSYYLKSWQKWN